MANSNLIVNFARVTQKKSMRVSFFTLLALVFTTLFVATGCTEKNGSSSSDTLSTDTLSTDTVDSISRMVAETAMPRTADELFDDFFFNFAASKKVQLSRTLFPLKMEKFGKASVIEKNKWKTEHFFMKQGYYTLIFNNKRSLSIMKDTAVNEVTVEHIAMTRGTVKQWHFIRNNGLWNLSNIRMITLKQHGDSEFLSFYQKFVSDTKFQQESLSETVTFTGPDPEDDFSTMTGEILPEQWPMFAPWLPSETIYNIVYSSPTHKSSKKETNVRFFLIRGIANGLQTDLTFVKNGGRWKLKKITT